MERARQKLKWDDRSEMAKTVFLVMIVVGGTLGGYGLFMAVMGTSSPLVVVTSYSMVPAIDRGDLLVLQARPIENINVGDIIVFRDTDWQQGNAIVHRVIGIDVMNDAIHLTTQGDANPSPDPGTRTADEVVGVVVAVLPKIGHVSLFLQTPIGQVSAIILFIIILVVPEFVCKDEEEQEKDLNESTLDP